VAADLPLKGRHAVVTGASRGIGAAIAARLSKLGAELTLIGRNAETLARVADTIANAHPLVCDVTDPDDVQRAFQTARTRAPIAVLVNNAGAAESVPFLKTSDEMLERMLAVNVKAAFRCTRAALPSMREAGWGRIVNVASTAGLKGYAYVSAYVASKHALVGMTRALAIELAREPITVNAVCPGFTDTDIVHDAVANIVRKTGRTEEQALEQLVANNPQSRLIRPDEVAETVAWLCGPESESITGQAIAIAGGEVMG
jgi:NAD(P)-dependent dehydrogenase (short-subunit alcohol dehydrogenase family)